MPLSDMGGVAPNLLRSSVAEVRMSNLMGVPAMSDPLEEDSTTWHRLREAALDRKVLCFELLANRTTTTSTSFSIYRARILGGWLVTVRPHDSVTFVPDPQHEWNGGSAD
jgi:hypothetical protein